MTRNIDELSNLTTRAVEPEKYFGEMDLNEEQVKKRVAYTKKANELFDVILILLMTMRDNGTLDYVYARDMLESWLLSLISEFTTPDDYLIDYATDTAYNFVDTTKKHIDEPWYTSSDRSLFNAENSANDVMNYSEYIDALHSGKTHKKWITEKDNRVRKTHKGLDGKTIGITEVFHVGFALMRFPKDYDLAMSFPEELVNCRCSIKYLPEELKDDILKQRYYPSARTTKTVEDAEKISDSQVLKLKKYEDLVGYFKNTYNISVNGFEHNRFDRVKVTLAGIDDMIKQFPELKGYLRKIEFDPNFGYNGGCGKLGDLVIGPTGLMNYGTGLHETAHSLDLYRTMSPDNPYSTKVLNQAIKNLGLKRNSKEYKNHLIKLCGSLENASNDLEIFAYSLESSAGGVRDKLGDEVYRITKGNLI